MAQNTELVPFQIQNGVALSDVLYIQSSRVLQGIVTPAAIDGSEFSMVEGSYNYTPLKPTAATWVVLWSSGSDSVAPEQFVIGYGTSRWVRLSPADFYGVNALRFTSNSVQGAQRTLQASIGVVTG